MGGLWVTANIDSFACFLVAYKPPPCDNVLTHVGEGAEPATHVAASGANANDLSRLPMQVSHQMSAPQTPSGQ